MLEETITGLGAGRLEDGTVHPAVPLVVHGIGALQVEKTAVLRFERGLQVGCVVNGMGPCVAGKQLEAMGETLREVKGQSVVPRTGVGKLRVDAVERNGNAEALGVASQIRQEDLSFVSDGEGLSRRNKTGEGWIGAGGVEEVEEGRPA